MISIIHPSRGRPLKSSETLNKWCMMANYQDNDLNIIISLDISDDQSHRYLYPAHAVDTRIIINDNKSCVDAINNAAKIATGNIFVVVSDDTHCFQGWDTALLAELEGKKDFLLKCKDGIQDYIVTMTVMDRKYYERDGHIYHPDFQHQFADTYLTCVADIRGRLIKSALVFPHNHYSILKETPDALNKRNDDTWKEGQKTFVRLMKQFTQEERARIKDPSMRGFLKHVGL